MKEEKINNGKEPVKGISKKKTAASVMADCRISAMKSGGTVLPTRISKAVYGLTINCSKVPSSRSLATDSEVSIRVMTSARITISEITRYHW